MQNILNVVIRGSQANGYISSLIKNGGVSNRFMYLSMANRNMVTIGSIINKSNSNLIISTTNKPYSMDYTISKRCIATQPPFIHLPPSPPREFNPDGTPKKYRLNQRVYNHKYDWERWSIRPAGVFHTVYYGEFAQEVPTMQAWLLQYPLVVAYIPCLFVSVLVVFCVLNINTIGIKPRRYTIEWLEASKERDRAENTNPITRYLDRRRKERGSHWIAERYLTTNPFFLTMRDHHDTQYLREKEE